MSSNTTDYSTRPLGLFVYRRREENQYKLEILVRSKDGKDSMPHVALDEGESYRKGLKRIVIEELGTDIENLRISGRLSTSEHPPDFRYRLMAAVPRVELPFPFGSSTSDSGAGGMWRWEVLHTLGNVYMYIGKPGLRASSEGLGVTIRTLESVEKDEGGQGRRWANIASEIERTLY